jgi:hypothetical protein
MLHIKKLIKLASQNYALATGALNPEAKKASQNVGGQ